MYVLTFTQKKYVIEELSPSEMDSLPVLTHTKFL